LKAAVKLILPLLSQAPRAYDRATLNVPAGDQFLDEQPRHDRFSSPGIIGEQEAKRLTREHFFIDSRDLMREGFDQRCVYGEHRVESMGEANPMRL
jgi:hypothetical protein